MKYAKDGKTIIILNGDTNTFVPSYENAPSEIRAKIDALGGLEAVQPYVEPPVPLPTLTPRQLRLMLLQIGMSEAMVTAQIEKIKDADEKAAALIEWNWATQYERDHPLVLKLAGEFDFKDNELDDLWKYASSI